MAVFGARRRQKSDAQRRLDGSRRRAHHHRQPQPVTGVPPVMPAWLDADEVVVWQRLRALLAIDGRDTFDVGPWLAVAASAAVDLQRWRAEAARSPRLVEATEKAHPAHQQYRIARRHWIDVLKEGGLTPASGPRVVRPEATPPPAVDDPFEALDRRLQRAREQNPDAQKSGYPCGTWAAAGGNLPPRVPTLTQPRTGVSSRRRRPLLEAGTDA